jgi:apolipoprotein N-acyltransferase
VDRRSLALAALSGLLLAASFPSPDLGFLAWFSLIPLLRAATGRPPLQGFLLGGLTGILFFAGTISWVSHSLCFYGDVPLLSAWLLTLLFCAYCALYPALFGMIIAHTGRRRPGTLFLAAPAAWTALELARAQVLTGFPWALLGYTQYRWLPLVQIADICGVYGVSFLIVLANAALAGIIGDRRQVGPLLASLAVLGAAAGYGVLRLQEQAAGPPLRVAVVQGNIEQDRKWDPAYQSEVIAVYERLTRDAVRSRPDVVIWPETATPFSFGGVERNDPQLTDGLRNFVRTTGTPLLTGSPTYERGANRIYELRNSALLLDRDGSTAAVYHKRRLVPFGEYVPLGRLLFFAGKMVRTAGDFRPGGAYTVMELRPRREERAVPFSTVICYEIVFPDLVRRFVDRGAVVMTTITNDAWFGRTAAPYQHFAMAVLRAVENRVPVARAANTGISGFIDARGRIVAATDIFTEACLVSDLIPASGSRTFYTRCGDVFAWLCGLMTLVLSAAPVRKNALAHNRP